MNRYGFPGFPNKYELLKCLEMIKALKPYVLFGYPSNLYRIVKMWQDYDSSALQIPMIVTTGEMLYGYQREYLGQQLSGQVYDYYGCNEVGSIAFECEYHVKHIADERVYIEITDEAGKPTSALGDITITDLENYAMPFIRYKNGDTGTIVENCCKCERGLTVLMSIDGRAQEYLRALDGNYVPAIFFPATFRDLKGIDQYQIVQTDERTIILKIVKNRSFSGDELAAMTLMIKSLIGEAVLIKIEECDHIPLSRIGKTRHVISHVPFELRNATSMKASVWQDHRSRTGAVNEDYDAQDCPFG
jgi:phenylacetate-CoA ligase